MKGELQLSRGDGRRRILAGSGWSRLGADEPGTPECELAGAGRWESLLTAKTESVSVRFLLREGVR